jgi:hypothetical protein
VNENSNAFLKVSDSDISVSHGDTSTEISWDVTPYSLADYYQNLGGEVLDRHCEDAGSVFLRHVAKNLIHYMTSYSRRCDSLQAGRSGDRIPVGARFSAPVQTGPGAYPATCTMGTGSFPRVTRPGRGVDHPPPSRAEVIKERV